MKSSRHIITFVCMVAGPLINAADQPAPIAVEPLLQKGLASNSLPEGMVIRITACLGAPEVKDAGAGVLNDLKEAWEFTPDQVHRVSAAYEKDKCIYHRVESRPFNSNAICKELLDGKAVEINERKGNGPETGFVGTGYNLGSRFIEVVWHGGTVLELHESNTAFLDLYRESDARAFGALYERLASQARAVFEVKAPDKK